MLTSLRNATLKTLSIRGIALFFSLGVIVAALIPLPSEKFSIILDIIIVSMLLVPHDAVRLVLCGTFSYWNFSVCGDTSVPEFITSISTRFCEYIDTLPLEHCDLIKALLQGDKSGLTKETISLFRDAGAAHLLALSGLHVGILYMIFDLFLPKRYGFIRYIIIVSAALFFTLMVGARPSIVRAFLFILFRETSRLIHYPLDLLDTLCLAFFVQLVITPSVITSIGFQLSYSAVLGIALLFPLLDNCYEGEGFLKRVWQCLSITIACQLFTTPVSWYYFRTFPMHFLLANLIAIPATSIFMYCAILVIVLSAIGICPNVLYVVTDFVGDLLLTSLQIINQPL